MYLWANMQMQIEKEHEQRHGDASAKNDYEHLYFPLALLFHVLFSL